MNGMNMNIENIDLAINMLKRLQTKYPDALNMEYFQFIPTWRMDMISEDEFICGTTCCFSGWMAIADEFKDYPNKISTKSFKVGYMDTIESIATVFGISHYMAAAIIYPVTDNSLFTKVWGKYEFKLDEDSDSYYNWRQIKYHHLIDVLERIKSGELPWI